jgi:uncharacterized protein
MEYTQGNLGRVFVARLHDGESIYDAVQEIAQREGVTSAAVLAVGGIRSGRVVTGPETPDAPMIAHVESFEDARELAGVGTVFLADGKPSIHLHAAIGRRDSALAGCPREGMATYILLEVVIIELEGVDAKRMIDPDSGLRLLRVMQSK